jgi:hypothetical protein
MSAQQPRPVDQLHTQLRVERAPVGYQTVEVRGRPVFVPEPTAQWAESFATAVTGNPQTGDIGTIATFVRQAEHSRPGSVGEIHAQAADEIARDLERQRNIPSAPDRTMVQPAEARYLAQRGTDLRADLLARNVHPADAEAALGTLGQNESVLFHLGRVQILYEEAENLFLTRGVNSDGTFNPQYGPNLLARLRQTAAIREAMEKTLLLNQLRRRAHEAKNAREAQVPVAQAEAADKQAFAVVAQQIGDPRRFSAMYGDFVTHGVISPRSRAELDRIFTEQFGNFIKTAGNPKDAITVDVRIRDAWLGRDGNRNEREIVKGFLAAHKIRAQLAPAEQAIVASMAVRELELARLAFYAKYDAQYNGGRQTAPIQEARKLYVDGTKQLFSDWLKMFARHGNMGWYYQDPPPIWP